MSIQLNIHNRLALVHWGAALLAFVVAAGGLVLFHSLTLEHRARLIVEPYAQLVSVGTVAAVAFEDPQRAQEVLDTLRANPQILEADIFLNSGRVLARFSLMANSQPRPFPTQANGIYLSRDKVELLQALHNGARLRLTMSLDQLSQQTQQMLWLFATFALVLLIATFAQLSLLRRTMVAPIASLTEASERIRASADYRHRVPASGTDEVARLCQSFNAMMAAILDREIELRRLSVFQRTILDNAAYCIISTTPEGIVTSFNPAAERLLGYSADEMIGIQTPTLWHDADEIVQRARQLSEQLGETISSGFEVFAARPRRNLPEQNEWTFVRKDGTRLTVLLSITSLRDENDQINGFVGLAYDLTERKKSEQQLTLLNFALNIVDEAAYLIDENAHFTYVNDQCSRKLGYSRSELLSMSVTDIDPDFPQERWRKYWDQILVQRSLTFETRHRTKEGQFFPVEINVSYFEYQGRKYNLAFARDITLRKQTEYEHHANLHFFESMDRINRAIQGADNLQQMMSDVLDCVLTTFDCDRVYLLYPCDAESHSWSIPMERTRPKYPGFLAQQIEIPTSPETAKIFSILSAANHPVKFDLESEYAMPAAIKKLGGFQSSMAMALHPKTGKSWEFGLQQCSYSRVWTLAEERLVQEIGRRLADGLTGMLSHHDLQVSEEKYRTLIQKIQVGVIVHGGDTQILSSNAMAQELLGLAEDELLGKKSIDLDWHLFRDDGSKLAVDEYPVNQVLSSHKPLRNRILGSHRPKQHDMWALVNADPVFDNSGEISQVIVTFIDITEHRQVELRLHASEQEFRTLAENSPDVIVRYDSQGRRIYVNPEFERVNRLTAHQVLGKTPVELSTELKPWAEVFTENLMAAMASGLASKLDLSWIVDGKPVCWFVRIVPEFNEDGKVMSALTIWSDITQRKQVEEELRQYKDQLEETVRQRTAELLLARDAAEAANKAKSVFLANMSHELRTPLNAILGFSNILRKNPSLEAEQRRDIEIINKSGEHLLALINDVLEMAKIEAGRVQLEEAPFDLGEMLRDVMNMMQVRAAEKNLQLIIDQASVFPRYIVGDQARLRQVLINLVGNALKFTLQGGVTVRLSTKDNACSHLIIEVEDSGPGIAPEYQQRIFEPFAQIGQLADNKGTGLGLSITRQFVQLMKGRISLESMPGKGSLFRIDLPLTGVGTGDIDRLYNAKQRDVLALAPGQVEYRILIVEDQLENQLLLTHLMSTVGFQVKVADNGEQGVALFSSWQPHLIWMDKQMPVMDGLEAAKIIRSLPGGDTVKIVAVTASAFEEQRSEILLAGMDGLVRKPYRAQEIYDCLARQLGVEYFYDEQSKPAVEPVVLTAAMLSVLPDQLRRALETAVTSLESERIDEVIAQIADYDKTVQAALSQLAETYDYPAILKALRTN
jgi:PAS domain S-box-containing protein